MSKKQKNLQDIFRKRQMKNLKHDYIYYKIQQLWTLVKRLAFIASLGYSGVWVSKPDNQQTLKSFLKSHSTPIEQKVDNFKEEIKMVNEAGKDNSKQAKAFYQERERIIKEYRKEGIDPVIKYAEAGTKAYQDELEFYRREKLFKSLDD